MSRTQIDNRKSEDFIGGFLGTIVRQKKRMSFDEHTKELPIKVNHKFQFKPSTDHGLDLVRVNSRRRRSISRKRYVETMVVADASMFKAFDANEIELRSYLLSLMSIVRRIFQDASVGNAIEISVVKIVILKKEQADLKIPSWGANSAEKALKYFCKWQRKFNSKNDNSTKHYDTAILLTKKNICSRQRGCDTLGLAELGVICDRKRSCAVIEDNGIAAAFTVAHELGHLFNIAHDGIRNDCTLRNGQLHIMTPSFSLSSQTWSFSKCSRKYITDFLEAGGGNCLLDRPSKKVVYRLPRKMAGEIFNQNEQCRLVFGVDYESCSIIKTDCSKLYCQRKGGMINSNGLPTCSTNNMAPAEGTECDTNKWCLKGKCITRSSFPVVNGGWGSWSSFAACSRSCGGGISRSSRDCNNPRPSNGGSYCLGVRRRYRSCHSQPCPENSKSFRGLQCSAFNGKDLGINGVSPSVRWIPKYEGVRSADLCRLFCKIESHHVYYELSSKVIDGTPCRKGSFDVCVDGVCRPAGCDHVMNSRAKLDKCGVCNGDGSTCKTLNGLVNLTKNDYYNFVVSVPRGARDFKVVQHSSSNIPDTIALALMNFKGRYVFNGNYVIGLGSKKFVFNGQEIFYSGLNVVNETVWIPGKLKYPFTVHALKVGKRAASIRYSYIIPVHGKQYYSWRLDREWSKCSYECQGIQQREYRCLRQSDSQQVSNAKCKKERPAPIMRKCNRGCIVSWKIEVEEECSAKCGHGIKTQSSYCVKTYKNSSDTPEVIDNKHCTGMHRPPKQLPCHSLCTKTRWEYTTWGKCSKKCNRGVQTRKAFCVDQVLRKLPDKECNITARGMVSRSCNNLACPYWKFSEWDRCSVTCGTGIQQRSVYCVDGLGSAHVKLSYCNQTEKPDITRPCILRPCPAWKFGAWSRCSVTCGVGYQTRKIACMRDNGERVNEAECDAARRPVDRQECKKRTCPAEVLAAYDAPSRDNEAIWMTGAWTRCSKSCGQGIKQRYVSCRYRGGEQAASNLCDNESEPSSVKRCNERSCPAWSTDPWSKCSASCGGGIQTRVVTCKASEHPIASHYCSYKERPTERQVCNLHHCIAKTARPTAATTRIPTTISKTTERPRGEWKGGQWSPCSVTCGSGFKHRNVTCKSPINAPCLASEKPRTMMKCNLMPCPFWHYGDWTECSVSCGEGRQRRYVVCQLNNGTQLNANACGAKFRPPSEQSCERPKCPELGRWVSDQWQPCSVSCGSGFRYRDISCENGQGKRLPKHRCPRRGRPTQQKPCRLEACPQWAAEEWSECNDNCQKTRSVYCTRGIDILDLNVCSLETKPAEITDCPLKTASMYRRIAGKSVHGESLIAIFPEQCSKTCDYSVRVRNVKCVDERKHQVAEQYCNRTTPTPRRQQACFGGPCPAKWIPESWGECSVSCGVGIQQRRIFCEGTLNKRLRPISCKWGNRPSLSRKCDMGPCQEQFRWKTGVWTKCTRECGIGISRRASYCVDQSGRRKPNRHCVAKRPANIRACNTHSCPPMSCSDVQLNLGILLDGEHLLMTKEKKYLKVYCEGMGSGRPREYITLKAASTENYSEIYSKRLRNRRSVPTMVQKCDTVQIVWTTLLPALPEDTKFAIKFGRNPPPLASAGDCFSQAYCPQGSFKMNLTSTGLAIDESVRWRSRGYHVSQQIQRFVDGRVIVGRCGVFVACAVQLV
eukprot:gene5938-6628_t